MNKCASRLPCLCNVVKYFEFIRWSECEKFPYATHTATTRRKILLATHKGMHLAHFVSLASIGGTSARLRDSNTLHIRFMICRPLPVYSFQTCVCGVQRSASDDNYKRLKKKTFALEMWMWYAPLIWKSIYANWLVIGGERAISLQNQRSRHE